ncbi:MAG: hypothetical protein HYV62_10300 [Candidatus Rokubacteria bacterium]|nr:hypothetical protein [Candidatus Rokubacteria bacterium]
MTFPIDIGIFLSELTEPKRCPVCRTKIVVPDPQGVVVKNAILRVSRETGQASAKCPRCKAWVEVPLTYQP